MTTRSQPPAAACALTDEEIVARVLKGQRDLFEALMRRYNQRLFRMVRAIVRPDSDAEDALQEAYLSAYRRLDTFQGRSSLFTWLARIAMRAAAARRRKQRSAEELLERVARRPMEAEEDALDPERDAVARETSERIERAIDGLSETYRTVVVLRLVERMSTAEVAEALDLTEETVRVRLHRGREQLRAALLESLDPDLTRAFAFDGARCDRIVANVLDRIASDGPA